MKTLTRVILPLIVVVGLVFGIAYVTQYTDKSKPPDKPNDSGGDNAQRELLRFRELQANWNRFDSDSDGIGEEDQLPLPKDVELGSKHHYDFWFNNPHDQPVSVTLRFKSCTCASVMLGSISDQAWADWMRLRGISGLLANSGGSLLGPLSGLTLLHSVQWEELAVSPEGRREVAPSRDRKPGLLRVHFEAKEREERNITLGFDVLQQMGELSGTLKFSASFAVAPVVLILPPTQIDVGDISPGGKRQAEFLALSTTRDHFDASIKIGPAEADAGNPCFEVSRPAPLSRAECAALPAKLGGNFKNMKIKSGYRYVITVYENHSGRQLDLGPIARRIDVSVPGHGRVALIPLNGVVRGDVVVHGADDKGRIDFGSFKSEIGKQRTVKLSSVRKDFDLKIDHVTDSAIQCKLSALPDEEGKKHWNLHIEIPPYSIAGAIPTTTVVVIDTKGPNSRQLRVPIAGNAYR